MTRTRGERGFLWATTAALAAFPMAAAAETIEVAPTDWEATYGDATYEWQGAEHRYQVDGVPIYPAVPPLVPEVRLSRKYTFEIEGSAVDVETDLVLEMVTLGLVPTGLSDADQLLYDAFMVDYDARQQVMDQHMALVQTYFSLDDDALQAAIDRAHPGDIVELQPGTFRLARYGEEDATIDTANGSFGLMQDWWVPFSWKQLRHGVWDTALEIDTPGITVQGKNDPDDRKGASVVTLMNPYDDFQLLVIDAPHVTIQRLRFEGMGMTINAFDAGFDIRDNAFYGAGWATLLGPDAYSTYPEYPSTDHEITSYFRDNRMVGTMDYAVFVTGSEVQVTGNDVQSWWGGIWAASWGEYTRGESPYPLPALPLNWDHVNNVTIADNVIEAVFAVYITGFHGGELRSNAISRNTFLNAWIGVNIQPVTRFDDVHGGSDFAIDGNDFLGCAWPLELQPTADTLEDVSVHDNTFVGIEAPAVLLNPAEGGSLEDVEVRDNTFVDLLDVGIYLWPSSNTGGAIADVAMWGNDFSDSGLPGWDSGAGAIYVPEDGTAADGAPRSTEEIAIEVAVPDFPRKTTPCTQILDESGKAVVKVDGDSGAGSGPCFFAP